MITENQGDQKSKSGSIKKERKRKRKNERKEERRQDGRKETNTLTKKKGDKNSKSLRQMENIKRASKHTNITDGNEQKAGEKTNMKVQKGNETLLCKYTKLL